MGKEKKELHPADRERKRQRKKDLKKNKGLRKTQRETILQTRSPDEILAEIHKINRLTEQGLTDEKHMIRKKQLIDAHKSALKKQEAKSTAKKEEEPQVVIKGMNKIFRTKAAAESKKDEQLLLEDKHDDDKEMEDGDEKEREEEVKVEVSEKKEKKKEIDRDEKDFDEHRDKAYDRFTEEELEAMMFDEDMVAPASEDESQLLEAPPGIIRPPGLRAKRQRVKSRHAPPTALGPAHLVSAPLGPTLGPPRPPGEKIEKSDKETQKPEKEKPEKEKGRPDKRPFPLDPLDLETRARKKAEEDAAEEEARELAAEEERKKDRVVIHPLKSVISAGPQKPVLPTITSGSVAFVPTSLLVRNRPSATPRKPAPAQPPAKKLDKPVKQAVRRPVAREKPAPAASNVFDQFMKEIDDLEDGS